MNKRSVLEGEESLLWEISDLRFGVAVLQISGFQLGFPSCVVDNVIDSWVFANVV